MQKPTSILLKPLLTAIALALQTNAVLAGPDAPVAEAAAIGPVATSKFAAIDTITIVGAANKANIPGKLSSTSTVESVTAQQISESINAVTSGAVLQYEPSTHVRERYIGDVNGVLVMRINSSIQSAETVVYADGMLISNLLGNSYNYAPRWGLVAPSEIGRVDLIYGPFSALYPGNSEGGIVNIDTKMPEQFEVHAGADYIQQHYAAMGSNKNFYGNHETATLGHKLGDLRLVLSLDHTDNTGEPMTFNIPTVASGSAKALAGAVPVKGAVSYIGVTNLPTLVTSAIGIDHTLQDNAKIKLAYDFTPTLRASYIFDDWRNKSNKMSSSYLTDAATGATVYGGPTVINGLYYTVASPSVSTQLSDYSMHGLKLKSSDGGMLDWEINASRFNEDKDEVRTAAAASSNVDLANATGGTIAVGNGTGWKNLDLRGEFRPDGTRRSDHQLSFGYHFDQYVLNSTTYTLASGSNFTGAAPGARAAASKGQTATRALYLQEAWRMAPQWELVVGGRLESWQASSGNNLTSAANVFYADRSASAFSPKLALGYQATDDLGLRGSFGRATRFPTVNELFSNVTPQTTAGGTLTAIQVAALPAPFNAPTNNPRLKPERVDSIELSAEFRREHASWRNSFFAEYKKDAIISTTDALSLPGYTLSGNTNIDEVHTVGFETSVRSKDFLLQGLDLAGSATWVKSTIAADAGNPLLVGTDQPRIPKFRATVSGSYHQSDKLTFSMSYRYSGQQHVSLFNATSGYNVPNPNVYGTTVSSYSVVDVKAAYKIDKNWTASYGINNLTNCIYYVNPNPYPMRTIFASLKYDL